MSALPFSETAGTAVVPCLQTICDVVTPAPASEVKMTRIFESGALVKVAVAPEPGRLVVQLVPLTTVTPTLLWLAPP